MCRNTDKRKEGGKQLTIVVVVVVVVVAVVLLLFLSAFQLKLCLYGKQREGVSGQAIIANGSRQTGLAAPGNCTAGRSVLRILYIQYSLYIEHNCGLKGNDFISWNLSNCIAIV